MDPKTENLVVTERRRWIVADKITKQFFTEIEVHFLYAEAIIEDSNMVDYNSVLEWKNGSSLNFDVDLSEQSESSR